MMNEIFQQGRDCPGSPGNYKDENYFSGLAPESDPGILPRSYLVVPEQKTGGGEDDKVCKSRGKKDDSLILRRRHARKTI
jgi:hypothetical protein